MPASCASRPTASEDGGAARQVTRLKEFDLGLGNGGVNVVSM